jgi:hypothetical protein
MSRAKVRAVARATERKREHMVDRERVAGAGGQAAEPADLLLAQHLRAETDVRTVIASYAG